jgi:NitT/TauT family transport system substrate-binding protein
MVAPLKRQIRTSSPANKENLMKAIRNPLILALMTTAALSGPVIAETIRFGVGTQDTTTNTVTTGAVVRELKLLEKHLPKTGKYAGVDYAIEWQNFTSGPPVTNGMMANKLQFGTMGDFPLIVNGFTFQSNPEGKSQLIAVAAYNLAGSGNGVLVHKDSNFFELADLKDKVVSVPFGSAAHGMLLKAIHDRGWPADFMKLVSQSPEVGSTNLQEKKIDAHADFVPFAELLPHRGFARKVFDGVETSAPTWHGVVARTDFAEKHPDIVVAYIEAIIEADAWVKANPKLAAEKIAGWTGIDKEVVYIFLGPGGIMTLDPTIKTELVADIADDAKTLQTLGKIKEFDIKAWVNDSYAKKAFAEAGLDYKKQVASTANYEVRGTDSFCNKPITKPREAGEIWIADGEIKPYSSTACTLGAYRELLKKGGKANKVYLFDAARGVKLFADQAFFVVSKPGPKATIEPYLLKKDAEAAAAKKGGKVVDFVAATQSNTAGD